MTVQIRKATAADMPELLRLERTYFPNDTGYVHQDKDGGATFLLNQPDSNRWIISVADAGDHLSAFAWLAPFSMPGTRRLDDRSMLLQHLAVDPDVREMGIGRQVLDHALARIAPLGQNVIVSHVPPESRGFYDSVGWTTFAAGFGFAWQAGAEIMHADIPDPHDGFPHMAVKVLNPDALLYGFAFPYRSRIPGVEALPALKARVDSGQIALNQLHPETRSAVQNFRRANRSTGAGAFGR